MGFIGLMPSFDHNVEAYGQLSRPAASGAGTQTISTVYVPIMQWTDTLHNGSTNIGVRIPAGVPGSGCIDATGPGTFLFLGNARYRGDNATIYTLALHRNSVHIGEFGAIKAASTDISVAFSTIFTVAEDVNYHYAVCVKADKVSSGFELTGGGLAIMRLSHTIGMV